MGKSFKKTIDSLNPSDIIILWFVHKGSKAIASYVAIFDKLIPRELGPLVNVTMSSEDLGWEKGDKYDTEVTYTDIVDIRTARVDTGCLRCQSSWIRIRDPPEDLDETYLNIKRFCKCSPK